MQKVNSFCHVHGYFKHGQIIKRLIRVYHLTNRTWKRHIWEKSSCSLGGTGDTFGAEFGGNAYLSWHIGRPNKVQNIWTAQSCHQIDFPERLRAELWSEVARQKRWRKGEVILLKFCYEAGVYLAFEHLYCYFATPIGAFVDCTKASRTCMRWIGVKYTRLANMIISCLSFIVPIGAPTVVISSGSSFVLSSPVNWISMRYIPKPATKKWWCHYQPWLISFGRRWFHFVTFNF